MFEKNPDGHVMGVPRDAFWKSGAGGFALIIVPSLVWRFAKWAATTDLPRAEVASGHASGQYAPTFTDVGGEDGLKLGLRWSTLRA